MKTIITSNIEVWPGGDFINKNRRGEDMEASQKLADDIARYIDSYGPVMSFPADGSGAIEMGFYKLRDVIQPLNPAWVVIDTARNFCGGLMRWEDLQAFLDMEVKPKEKQNQ